MSYFALLGCQNICAQIPLVWAINLTAWYREMYRFLFSRFSLIKTSRFLNKKYHKKVGKKYRKKDIISDHAFGPRIPKFASKATPLDTKTAWDKLKKGWYGDLRYGGGYWVGYLNINGESLSWQAVDSANGTVVDEFALYPNGYFTAMESQTSFSSIFS